MSDPTHPTPADHATRRGTAEAVYDRARSAGVDRDRAREISRNVAETIHRKREK